MDRKNSLKKYFHRTIGTHELNCSLANLAALPARCILATFSPRTIANYPETIFEGILRPYFPPFVNNGDVNCGDDSKAFERAVTMVTFTRNVSRSVTITVFQDSHEWDILSGRRKEGNAKREWYKAMLDKCLRVESPPRERSIYLGLSSLEWTPLRNAATGYAKWKENVILVSRTLKLSDICHIREHVFYFFKRKVNSFFFT